MEIKRERLNLFLGLRILTRKILHQKILIVKSVQKLSFSQSQGFVPKVPH